MSQDTLYEFEWDPAKALLNLRDHGITFDQAATVFLDALALALTVYDAISSQDEERWFTPRLRRQRQVAGRSAYLPGDGARTGSGAHHLSAQGDETRTTEL